MYIKKAKNIKYCAVCDSEFLGHDRHKLCGNPECKKVYRKKYFNGYLEKNKDAIYTRLNYNQKSEKAKLYRKKLYEKNKILWSMKEAYKNTVGVSWDGGDIAELKAVSLASAFNPVGKNSKRKNEIIKERLSYERS